MSCREPIVSKVVNHNVKGLYSNPIAKREATILCEAEPFQLRKGGEESVELDSETAFV
jgi:hypothetical protein